MKAMLLAAAVAATAFTTNAMASPWPGCSFIEPGPMLDLCDRQKALYDAIYEDGDLTREVTKDRIKRLESKIEKLEREIETLQNKSKPPYP
jgi:hypothetical protein